MVERQGGDGRDARVEIVGGYERRGGEGVRGMREWPRDEGPGEKRVRETRAGVDTGVTRRWQLRQAPIWVY